MKRAPHTFATQEKRLTALERRSPSRVDLSDLTDAELDELEAYVIAMENSSQ